MPTAPIPSGQLPHPQKPALIPGHGPAPSKPVPPIPGSPPLLQPGKYSPAVPGPYPGVPQVPGPYPGVPQVPGPYPGVPQVPGPYPGVPQVPFPGPANYPIPANYPSKGNVPLSQNLYPSPTGLAPSLYPHKSVETPQTGQIPSSSFLNQPSKSPAIAPGAFPSVYPPNTIVNPSQPVPTAPLSGTKYPGSSNLNPLSPKYPGYAPFPGQQPGGLYLGSGMYPSQSGLYPAPPPYPSPSGHQGLYPGQQGIYPTFGSQLGKQGTFFPPYPGGRFPAIPTCDYSSDFMYEKTMGFAIRPLGR